MDARTRFPSEPAHHAADGSPPRRVGGRGARAGNLAACLAALCLPACGSEATPSGAAAPQGGDEPIAGAGIAGAGADAPATGFEPGPGATSGSPGTGSPGGQPAAPEGPPGAPDPAAGDEPPAAFTPPEPVGCVTDVTAGEHTFTCEDLFHIVSVPEACLDHACGMVIDIHGGTMSAEMENNNTNTRALGAERDFIVVQPNAVGGVWRPNVDDPKVFAFAQSVVQAFHVDDKRIHVMGFSQGGYMSWRFVCAHSDWLASAAPAAAAGAVVLINEVGCSFTGTDKPAQEIPVLYMHGTKDALVNIQNGLALRDAVLAAWGMTEDGEVSSDAGHKWTRYTNERGNVFEFIQHEYSTDAAVGIPPLGVAIVGHCYPGSHDLAASEPFQLMPFACKDDAAFTWGEVAMDFFVAHPKP